MQADQFQANFKLIRFKIMADGPPAALYHSRSSSWRVKYGNRIEGEESDDVHEIWHTKKFEELLLAWMRTVLEHSSFSFLLLFLGLEKYFLPAS
jgi:hypothetical protein